MKNLRLALWFGLLLAAPTLILAQEDACFAAVRTALAATLNCADIQRDQACYGNGSIKAEGEDIDFTQAGDVADLRAIDRLILSPADAEREGTSIALLKVQADMLDANPQDYLAMLLLGDIEVENRSIGAMIDVQVDSETGANVRTEPSTDAQVIRPLIDGQIVRATGRVNNTSWVRVQFDEQVGWVLSELVRSQDDLNSLPGVETMDSTLTYGPMQKFDFTSRLDDAPCEGAPDSGVLVQSPEDIEWAHLQTNGVEIRFSGTIFIQAQLGLTMIVNVLEGQAQVTVDDTTQIIDAGRRARVPLDEQGMAAQPPTPQENYDYNRMGYLPVELLPRQIIPELRFEEIVTPQAPSDPPLTGITSESPCTIAVTGDVNLRTGPGGEYPRRGVMLPGESAVPTGRAADSRGRLWWRLATRVWVSSDVVLAAGRCGDVPVVEAPILLEQN